MRNTSPFIYIIGWDNPYRSYIGVRYARGCHPSDLWTSYFTSSKTVHAFAAEHGPPTFTSIHKTTEEKAKLLEFWCIHTFDLANDDLWLNLKKSGRYFHRTVQSAKKAGTTLKRYCNDPDKKQLRRERALARWSDPTYREKQVRAIRNARCGVKHTDATKKVISEKKLGKKMTLEQRASISERLRRAPIVISKEARQKAADKLRGRIRSEETKEKLRKANIGKTTPIEKKLQNREKNSFLDFQDFIEWLKEHDLRTYSQWESLRKSDQIPQNIPKQPLKYFSYFNNEVLTWKKIAFLVDNHSV